jgi:AraC-like DNA-binding protein
LRYTELAGQAQVDRAKRLLASGQGTEDVAEVLGYADSRSFRRAFERWTGETPAQFRARR